MLTLLAAGCLTSWRLTLIAKIKTEFEIATYLVITNCLRTY